MRRAVLGVQQAATASALFSAPQPTEQQRFASKATSGNTRYQRRPPKKKPAQFHFIVGSFAKAGYMIRNQKSTYFASRKFEREPDFRAGENVTFLEKDYSLHAQRDGVMTVRHSKIDPTYKWVDIDPDIQKVKRTREMRAALGENASELTKHNPEYSRTEMHDVNEPNWRERVQAPVSVQERFRDPNLLVRGQAWSIEPKGRYTYE